MKNNIHIENYIVVKVDLVHLLPVYFKFYILVPNDYQYIKIIQDYGHCVKISSLENAARYTFLFVFLFFC